jgi:hypothetical protein
MESFRKSDPYRYKIIFSVEDADKLPQCKTKIILQKGDKKLGIGEEAVEYFYGKQGAIVAGLHKSSGDYYDWENGPNGNGNSDLPVAPKEWLKLRAVIRATKAAKTVKALPNLLMNGWMHGMFSMGNAHLVAAIPMQLVKRHQTAKPYFATKGHHMAQI